MPAYSVAPTLLPIGPEIHAYFRFLPVTHARPSDRLMPSLWLGQLSNFIWTKNDVRLDSPHHIITHKPPLHITHASCITLAETLLHH